jgi:hypothetical protein
LIFIKNKKELIYPIYEFNMLPAYYIDRSWLDPIIPNTILTPIVNSRRGLRQLSALILEYYNLKHSFFFEFNDPIHRYALLPNDILIQLTFDCAIALNHRAIKSVIDKHQKTRLMDCIGEKGYRFAVDMASLITGNLSNNIESEIVWDNLYSYFYNYGVSFFLSCYSNVPKHFLKRLSFKFNRNLHQDNSSLNININESLKKSIIKRIMKQTIDKQWQQLVS